MELTQVRLIVREFARTYRFYRDVLGFVPQHDNEGGPYAKLTPPGSSAAIALHDRADLAATIADLSEAVGDRALVVMKVDDLGSCVATMQARGAVLVQPVREMWGRMLVAHIRDPEGNLLEFQQWL